MSKFELSFLKNGLFVKIIQVIIIKSRKILRILCLYIADNYVTLLTMRRLGDNYTALEVL